MKYQYILDRLPYKSSFRFVDEISFLDPDKVVGHYTLRPDAFFYADHFPGNPVTPGAILTEIMAQIGLVVLGIFLVSAKAEDALAATDPAADPASDRAAADPAGAPDLAAAAAITAAAAATTAAAAPESAPPIFPLLTSADVSFLKMVLPGQKVTVISSKVYFRFDKLKCKVEMRDAGGEPIAKGTFAGMIRKN